MTWPILFMLLVLFSQDCFNYGLDCFGNNGYEEKFLTQYFYDIVSKLSTLMIPDRSIDGLKNVMEELCNPGNVSLSEIVLLGCRF